MFSLSWETATALAVISATVVGIIGLIHQLTKKEPIWKTQLNDHNLRITTIEAQIDFLSKRIDAIKSTMDLHDKRDTEEFNRIDKRIEKLVDLTIRIISEDKTNDSL